MLPCATVKRIVQELSSYPSALNVTLIIAVPSVRLNDAVAGLKPGLEEAKVTVPDPLKGVSESSSTLLLKAALVVTPSTEHVRLSGTAGPPSEKASSGKAHVAIRIAAVRIIKEKNFFFMLHRCVYRIYVECFTALL